jgi:hypothetical protein
LLEAEELVQRLNRKLRGWANYFKLGPVSKAYRLADTYTTRRLRRHEVAIRTPATAHRLEAVRAPAKFPQQALALAGPVRAQVQTSALAPQSRRCRQSQA